MIIKKLSKEELAEGLTLELVNRISMEKNYSPVQLAASGEVSSILKCSAGFWLMVDGKATKGADGKLLVLSEKECQIARARYLLTHGAAEKEAKIQAEIARLKKQVRDKIDEVKYKADVYRPKESDSSSIINLEKLLGQQLRQERGDEWYAEFEAQNQFKHDSCIQAHEKLEQLWSEGRIIELLEGLGIKKFDPLMLSVKLDDEDGIRVLKNTFSAGKIHEWMDNTGGDPLYKYIQIEIEKQYPM